MSASADTEPLDGFQTPDEDREFPYECWRRGGVEYAPGEDADITGERVEPGTTGRIVDEYTITVRRYTVDWDDNRRTYGVPGNSLKVPR